MSRTPTLSSRTAQAMNRDRAAKVALFRAHLREFFRALEECIVDRGWDFDPSSSIEEGKRISLVFTAPNVPAAGVSARSASSEPEARVRSHARARANLGGAA
jgi:hypothetical protein